MAHPAKEARDRAQLLWPGATVVARLRNSIKHQHPTIPSKFMLDIGIGPMHYGPAEDQEINTAWQPGTAPWDFEMVQAGYNAFALANFSSGQIVKYVHPGTGESVAFQSQQLQYTNDLDQIQAIANPQSVSAVVQNEDVLFWQGAFGPGMDIRWQTQTARLDKRLVVDQASRWPAPTAQIIAGGNPVARLQFIFQVSNNLNVFVNGVLWNRAVNNPVDTQGYIEFRHQGTGEVLWTFNLPRSNGAPVEDQAQDELLGTFRLRRTGPNLFVEHRIPIAWLQAADYPIEIDVTIDEQVGTGSDDAFQATDDTVTVAGGSMLIDATTEHGGYRWTTVGIPVGATIDLAQVGIVIASTANDEPQHRLRGELAANPGTFTTGTNNIDARSRTTASVQWNSTNLGAANGSLWEWGATIAGAGNGADLSSIVQEIVDQGGWASNNALVMIYEQHTADSARDLQVQNYETDTTWAAKLHIEYSSGIALVVQDAAIGLAVESPALTQHNLLVLADALLALGADSPALTQHNLLAIADALLALAADSPTLGVGLVLQDALLALASESPDLVQHNVLVVADALLALAAETPTLTQHNALAVADALLSLAAESPALTQHNILAVADALIALAAESPTLTAHEPGASIVVQDAALGLSADSPVLTQHNVLVVADALVALAAESPALTQHNILVVADALFAVAAESPVLTQHNALAVADALLALSAEAPSLTQHNLLVVADALLALAADSVVLTQHNVIAVSDAALALAADNIVLEVPGILSVQDATIALSVDNVALVQHGVLVVQDALIGLTADVVGLVGPPAPPITLIAGTAQYFRKLWQRRSEEEEQRLREQLELRQAAFHAMLQQELDAIEQDDLEVLSIF